MTCKQGLVLLFLGLMCLASRAAPGSSEADEKALWNLWSLQTNQPARHESILDACRQLQKTAPNSPLLPVSRGLAAWHNLRLGQTNEAISILNEMTAAAPATPTAAAGIEMGRRWLTRLDREKVRGALAAYYRSAIEYPINLQPLKKSAKETSMPLADRWGAPWQYQLATFKVIKVARGQRYLLQSKTLGDSSDLSKALERPYADRIQIEPVSLSTAAGGAQNITFQIAGERPEKIILSERGQAGGITLTYIGSTILILCDGDHWRVVGKPAR